MEKEDKGKTQWKGGNSNRGGTSSYRGRGSYNARGEFHGKCYKCGGKGHRSFQCKSYGENIGRNDVIQGESKQPQCNPKARENLMIRRTLCSKEVSKELVMRRSIFKTRCKIVEKCYKMIIDSGNSTNFHLRSQLKNCNCKGWNTLIPIMFLW